MPIDALALLTQAGLAGYGPIAWGTPIPSRKSGVYIIALPDDPKPIAPNDAVVVADWIARVPGLAVVGQSPTTTQALEQALQRFWLPDETILYIGKATSLRRRLGQFYRHRLGERRPHKGGHWLKTLSDLASLRVYFAECEDFAAGERLLLARFADQVSITARSSLPDPSIAIPFANRELRPGIRKPVLIRTDVI
jgi:hypothetical protein